MIALVGIPTAVIAQVPTAVIGIAPVGAVVTSQPEYRWTESTTATEYRLFVRDVSGGGTLHLKTYAASDVCDGSTCSVLPEGLELPESSQMLFRVRAQNAAGNSGYSNATRFSYSGDVTPPQQVTLLGPSGVLVSNTPSFSWNSSATATEYRLYVRDVSGGSALHLKTYAASDVCEGGICSVVAEGLELPESSQMLFRVRAQNAAGNSGYSAASYFSYIGDVTPPQPVTLLGPSGVLVSNTPSFSWNSSATATEYRLYVRDVSGGGTLHLKTYAASDVCDGSTCSVLPEGLELPESSQVLFRVRAQNAAGNSGYSAASYFSYIGDVTPPQPVTLLGPSGVLVSNTPSFSWNSSATATEYRLYVRDVSGGGTLHLKTYAASDVCEGGICSLVAEGLELPESSQMLFRVRAQNVAGNSGYSSARLFSYDGPIAFPAAVGDSAVVTVAAPIEIDVTANDTDSDGSIDVSTVTAGPLTPSHGVIAINPATGVITYTPGDSVPFGTVDEFNYTVKDNLGFISEPAVVQVTFVPEIVVTVQTNNSVEINTFDFYEGPTSGVTINSNFPDVEDSGSFGYISTAGSVLSFYTYGEIGNTSFRYRLDGPAGPVSDVVTVRVSVVADLPEQPEIEDPEFNGPNDAPIAIADNVTVFRGETLLISVLANDLDPDSPGGFPVDRFLDPSSVDVFSTPSQLNGQTTVNPDGTVVYTHDGSAGDSASFQYTVKDLQGEVSESTNVSIDIVDQNSQLTGRWGDVISLPTIPVSAANLPDGRVLTWSSYAVNSFTPTDTDFAQTYTSIFNPDTEQSDLTLVTNTDHDMFCPGTNVLSDGRVLVNGGNSDAQTSIFDPLTNTWAQAEAMNIARAYQGNTILADGSVLTLGGSWNNGPACTEEGQNCVDKKGEVWTAGQGWRVLNNVSADPLRTDDFRGLYRSDNHMWLYTVEGGDVLHVGPSKNMHMISTDGQGSVVPVGTRADDDHAMNGNAVMYDVGKILTIGGAPDYDGISASDGAFVVEVSDGNVSSRRIASMNNPRVFHNSVVLPSGEVLVVGGQTFSSPFSDANSVLAPELWNPDTETFSELSAMAIPRNYHSVALLLADGRVLVGGGGLCDTCITNHPDVEIFSPPYLFSADGSLALRPQILSAPSSISLGAQISVQTNAAISDMVLVRASSVTHSVNNGQRRIPLNVVSNGQNLYSAVLPSDAGVLIPGNYMLFVLDGNGVPSESVLVNLGVSSSPEPFVEAGSAVFGSTLVFNPLTNGTNLNPASVLVTSQPAAGEAVVQGNGTIVYTHDGVSEEISDSFLYAVTANDGTSTIVEVSVAIAPDTNLQPTAGNDVYVALESSPKTLFVLSNDSDPDGSLDVNSIAIVQMPDNGSLLVGVDGALVYTPDSGAVSDVFTYTVRDNDGKKSEPATVNITIVEAGVLAAFHRSGQTFLTWSETSPADEYHVYRASSPINFASLASAQRITDQWGALGSDTSVNVTGGPNVPSHFVIEDLGEPLSDAQGLFVYTTQDGEAGTAYYAVTSVTNGVEDTNTLQTSAAVDESVEVPRDVLTVSVNGGLGRIYTQYMDYSNWNPTFNGYAYNYSVALPSGYDPSQAYPLLIHPHAYYEVYKFENQAEYNWQVIQLFPNDPGPTLNSTHSWWYGYSANHDYRTNTPPSSGVIENFTEQRVMRSIDELIINGDFNVNEQLIHAYGNSMGASGSVAWAMRYPSLLAGVYASQPMMNYDSSPQFASEFVDIWGSKGDNLPIVNNGPRSGDVSMYGENGLVSVGVWDWMNHHQQLIDRRGDEFAYLMTSHGKNDTVIDWSTQGKPSMQAYTDATVGFSAVYNEFSHTWAGFDAVVISLFGFGYDDDFNWKYPLNLSFPAIKNATASGPVIPADSGVDSYNLDIEWATPHTPFDTPIVDTSDQYEITLRSTSGLQSADITPRRTQQFSVDAGDSCDWSTTNRDNGQELGAGSVVVDADSLVTVPGVMIGTGTGTRLAIDCQ